MMFDRESVLSDVSEFLILFAGVATVASIAVASRFGRRSWAPAALLAATIAWSLTWVGTLLNGYEMLSPRLVGYWTIIVSIGVVIVGAIMVLISARRPAPRPADRICLIDPATHQG